jgi:DNA-binding response OmpR family regulator
MDYLHRGEEDGRKAILVVDDDPNARQWVADLLEQHGYEVSAVDEFRKACTLLQLRRFDLLITDLRMPQGDGFTMLSWVRAAQADLPILALTAYPSRENLEKVKDLGGLDMVDKASGAQGLLDSVRLALLGASRI